MTVLDFGWDFWCLMTLDIELLCVILAPSDYCSVVCYFMNLDFLEIFFTYIVFKGVFQSCSNALPQRLKMQGPFIPQTLDSPFNIYKSNHERLALIKYSQYKQNT